MMREFIDTPHPIEAEFYEKMDNKALKNDAGAQIVEFQHYIQEDPDFYTPYLLLAALYTEIGNEKESENYIELAYHRAKERVWQENNRWPEKLEWEAVENRPIIKTFLNQASRWWKHQAFEDALSLLKQMLKMDPVDNAGVRFFILAIRMGMSVTDYESQFLLSNKAFISADVMGWFMRHSRNYPDDFGEWEQIVGKLLAESRD
jgi:tetratricopeptide (TPR) repeat protein